MKKIFILSILICNYCIAHSQNVGIGTLTPDASAQLDITNTGKGLLIPRMGTGAINAISNPAKGLLVYDSVKNQLMVNMGTTAIPNWQTVVAGSGWALNGNSGINPVAYFIGTTDNNALQFRVNNIKAGWIDGNNIIFGLSKIILINTRINTRARIVIHTSNTHAVRPCYWTTRNSHWKRYR